MSSYQQEQGPPGMICPALLAYQYFLAANQAKHNIKQAVLLLERVSLPTDEQETDQLLL